MKDMPVAELGVENELRRLEARHDGVKRRYRADINVGGIKPPRHAGGDERLVHFVMRQIIPRIIGKDFQNRRQPAVFVDKQHGGPNPLSPYYSLRSGIPSMTEGLTGFIMVRPSSASSVPSC